MQLVQSGDSHSLRSLACGAHAALRGRSVTLTASGISSWQRGVGVTRDAWGVMLAASDHLGSSSHKAGAEMPTKRVYRPDEPNISDSRPQAPTDATREVANAAKLRPLLQSFRGFMKKQAPAFLLQTPAVAVEQCRQCAASHAAF